MLKAENKSDLNKRLVIWVNATNDINPSQECELKWDDWEIYLANSFELFFKKPENAKTVYTEIFEDVKRITKERESTKISIFSHKSNANKIRKWKSDEFKIYITINKWDDEIEYNLWTINNEEELQENLDKLWLSGKWIDTSSLWLKWIADSKKGNWYIRLFNYWVGWGTHNIASSIISFSELIHSKWFKIISPDMVDDTREYTSRTSLFMVDKDWEKFCIRTNANKEQLDIIYKEVIDNKEKISDILVTTNKGLSIDWVRKHSVPTNFNENVLHDVLTVVFNCEDREMWEVLNAVINEAEIFLEVNNLDFDIKEYLSNLLTSLKFLKMKLLNYNIIIFNKNSEKKNIKNWILEYTKMWTVPKELDNQKNNLWILNVQIIDLWNKRLNVLKEILFSLVEITKITEANIEQEPDENWLWRVVIITDWKDGSVWSIESNNHEVFFTNTIWNIWEYEKKFFKTLNNLSKWQIDLDVRDTTWCWDSSTAAALMIREADWINLRKQKYIEIFEEMWVSEKSYDKSIAIIEAYFLSHFQEVISWVVYHCKKSNLWDIHNSEKINSLILWYVFKNTLIFAREWVSKFRNAYDSSIVTDWRIYEWFNVNKINELG